MRGSCEYTSITSVSEIYFVVRVDPFVSFSFLFFFCLVVPNGDFFPNVEKQSL